MWAGGSDGGGFSKHSWDEQVHVLHIGLDLACWANASAVRCNITAVLYSCLSLPTVSAAVPPEVEAARDDGARFRL